MKKTEDSVQHINEDAINSLGAKKMNPEESSILDLPLNVLDKILALHSSGEAQKLGFLATMCKSFSVPGRAVSKLSIDRSLGNKYEEEDDALQFYELQSRMSRLIHFVPNVSKIKSSFVVDPLTLYFWSKSVRKTLVWLDVGLLSYDIVKLLHTFSALKELKGILTTGEIAEARWEGCQNVSKITNLELEIRTEKVDD